MVQCVDCGNMIDKIPAWLSSVSVRFVCDACRQKHPKPLAFVDSDADTTLKSSSADGETDEAGLDEAALEGEDVGADEEEDPGFGD